MTAGRPKQLLERATATARTEVNPERFENRSQAMAPELEPPTTCTDPEIAVWFEHTRKNACWLRESDRVLVTAFSVIAAKIHKLSQYSPGDQAFNLTDKEVNALVKISSALGLTPTSRQNVQFEREQSEDDFL